MRMLLDDAAISIAAIAVAVGRGVALPEAMLRTNGSISVAPTIAARPKIPASPNRPRAQVEASDTTTNNTAKISAALSSSGLVGAPATGREPATGVPSRCHAAARIRPQKASANIAGASVKASPRSNIATTINRRRYMIAVARMIPVCAWRSSAGSARARRARTTVVAVDE